MKRVAISELLDTDAGTPDEVAASLCDLRRINRWFGGVATTADMVDRVARETKRSSLSLLEVAAGSGYVPETVRQRLERYGLHLEVTVLDRVPSHLSNGNPAVAGDALALPFRVASFDLLSCNLFAHHLSPPELVQFVEDRKSTRLNSSHGYISYAVFCLKKKKNNNNNLYNKKKKQHNENNKE